MDFPGEDHNPVGQPGPDNSCWDHSKGEKRIFCFKEIQMSKSFGFETSYQEVFVLALVFDEVIQW